MMDVGRLQRFEGKITAQGNLLLHGPLLCTESGNTAERNSSVAIKPRELQVFLFQQSIIFSEIVGKRTQFVNPSYIYKNHIQVSNPFNFFQKSKCNEIPICECSLIVYVFFSPRFSFLLPSISVQ